jgi:ribosome production factor 2
MWKAAMKRPKLKKQDLEKGLGKKRKNMEVDEMGDLRGRVHIAKQDLSMLQTRKMKGLKSVPEDEEDSEDSEQESDLRRKKRKQD